MATASVTVSMDEDLKKQAETLFDGLGMSMTTAFILFAQTAVRQQKIPFEPAADLFYSAANMAHLRRVIVDTRQSVAKTIAELEVLEDE